MTEITFARRAGLRGVWSPIYNISVNNQGADVTRRTGLARFFSKGNEALLRIIGDRIREQGKITFADFMEMALYHPEIGYYNRTRERIGKHGDFTTGPETHSVFGALIARQLEQMWRLLDRPQSFDVVEMGAGPGSLCRDILAYARSAYPDFFSAIRYRIIESSADFVSRQKDLLGGIRPSVGNIRWYDSLDRLPNRGISGCFLSNELVDAFPVHRVVNIGGEIKEVYVGQEDGELVDILAEPSDPAVLDYFKRIEVDLPDGCQGEVNLLAVQWIKNVARHLKKGFVLTVDYGYPASELYSPARRRGTLLCYYKHTYVEDPYVRVGQQDITAHVDLTALIRAGEEAGLKPLLLCSQSEFLLGLGLQAVVESLERRGLTAMEYRANRLAMEELIKPDELGRLKVLVQGKGVDALPRPVFDPDASEGIPLLSSRFMRPVRE